MDRRQIRTVLRSLGILSRRYGKLRQALLLLHPTAATHSRLRVVAVYVGGEGGGLRGVCWLQAVCLQIYLVRCIHGPHSYALRCTDEGGYVMV